ncbi:MAG: NAD(P)/FAD-dependent oxidoreductase [Yonghaparkia sp.]|nr:NAD(P)/FAD-dependent oxidoreductase [Microcella sp.]
MTNLLTPATPARATTADAAVDRWMSAFSAAVDSGDTAALASLVVSDCSIRDLLALGWDLRNAIGRDEAVTLLSSGAGSGLSISQRPNSAVHVDEETGNREAFLTFRSANGSGDGFVRLVQEDGEWRASALLLSLSAIDSHPWQLGENRPIGKVHGPVMNRTIWSSARTATFAEKDPTVVILGSGHNGLILAARLKALGIDSLIIERNERVGDNWRKRYSSLALHTPIPSDQLPYVPYPPTWTRFTPKDKLGDFLESYAMLLDLPVWTSTSVENVRQDAATGMWSLDVIRADGTRRTMTPNHLVFATGMNGEPFLPDLPGIDTFGGTVIHAVQYDGYEPWVGKKAVVIGAGVSGHDLAQDLAEHGALVTMIQRSPTVVMNTSTFHAVMHANHVGGRFTTDDADLVNATIPFGDLPRYGVAQMQKVKEMDAELHTQLEKAGFWLSDGPNGQGALGLIFANNATGYYYNAGGAELIIDGTITLEHGNVVGLTDSAVQLEDGRTLEADLVIFATGYRGATTAIRTALGDEIADQLGEFAHVGPDREYGRLWRHTGLDRLWFMISLGIDSGRFYSTHLALQIAAIEAGTLTPGLQPR